MKAKNNTLKTILAILVIVLISLISFIGIFVKDKNKMVNVLPDYKLGMDFNGGRKVNLTLLESNDSIYLTKENYEKAKDIIIERLKLSGVQEYDVRRNSKNGDINVIIPEDDYTDDIMSTIYEGGDFKIVDSQEAKNDTIITAKEIRDIEKKLKDKNIENYKIVLTKREEKTEATETKEEETKTVYESNIVLSEDNKIIEKNKEDTESKEKYIVLNDGSEVKIEDLNLSSYNIVDNNISDNDIILSSEKMNKIQEELSKANINQYSIKQEDGQVYILNSDENKIENVAEIEVKNEALLSKKDIKDVQVGYGTENSQARVVLTIQFNKEGTNKLNELSKIYKVEETEDENSNSESEESSNNQSDNIDENSTEEQDNTQDEKKEEDKKQVSFILDGQTLITTEFDEEIKDGKIQLTVGSSSASDISSLSENLKQASSLSILLKTETIPLTYNLDSNIYVKSDITNDVVNSVLTMGIIIAVVIIIFTIVKYKKDGVLAIASVIGYVALLLIALRYTNVTITILGIAALIISIILDYIYKMALIKNKSKNTFKEISCKFLEIYIPCLIIAVVFAFNKFLPIASFGMVMFWSILSMIVYNAIITRALLKISKNK